MACQTRTYFALPLSSPVGVERLKASLFIMHRNEQANQYCSKIEYLKKFGWRKISPEFLYVLLDGSLFYILLCKSHLLEFFCWPTQGLKTRRFDFLAFPQMQLVLHSIAIDFSPFSFLLHRFFHEIPKSYAQFPQTYPQSGISLQC